MNHKNFLSTMDLVCTYCGSLMLIGVGAIPAQKMAGSHSGSVPGRAMAPFEMYLLNWLNWSPCT